MIDILTTPFSSTKLKSRLRMTATRLHIDAVKKTALMKQNMREVAELLNESPPNETKARLRAEALIQGDNTIEALEILKAECELLAERVSMIDQYQECPPDLVPSVSDIIFAAPRLGIEEMTSVRRQFRKKFGRAFKNKAMNNDGGVLNPKVVNNLALQPPTKATINLYMEKICKQYQVDWIPTVIELSQRHVVPATPAPEFPVTTGLQQTDSDIVHGRPRNLSSMDVLPPPPPTAPGYSSKGGSGNDAASVTSSSSDSSHNNNNNDNNDDGGGGGGSVLPVAQAYNATEVSSPTTHDHKDSNMMDLKHNSVSCY